MNRLSPSETRTLAEHLQRTAAGDRAAFRQLYDATSPKLYGVVLRIIGNTAIAEEVVQDTYIKVWQNAERFSPDAGHPLAWLVTMARNRAIDRLRSERFDRFKDVGAENELERMPAPGGDDVGTRETLRVCLAELDDEARSCVMLAYCSGYSREELADRFRRPVGTIKTLLHRSIKVLRTCLDRE